MQGVLLNVIEELRHLFGVQLARRVIYALQLFAYLNRFHQEFFAVVHINIFLWCSRLSLDTGEPHPHQVILRYAAFLICSLNGDGVLTIRQQGENVGQFNIERQPPIVLCH